MKNLSRTYLIALAIIALVIGFSQYLVQNSIKTGSTDSRTINISGRQRMLSQKISKATLAMSSTSNESEFEQRKNELSAALDLLIKSHEGLQNGSEELQLLNLNNSKRILTLFEQVDPHFLAIKNAAAIALKSKEIADTKSDEFKNSAKEILSNEAQFLKLMNDITFEYDAESTARVLSLSRTEYILFAIALLLLVMEGLFIFRPAIRKIQEYTEEILLQGKSLEASLEKEEYLNNQARSIFANVKQGVFLLNKDLMISEFYSAETENIFDEGTLRDTNFIKLMRPRLVKRDLEALEMFTDHLFNSEIRETVVNRLNPVESVEIFPNKGNAGNLDSRNVKISFSRIIVDEEIRQILVTVIDETENVKMRKAIEESEEKNRVESTQLLAILKIEPQTLDVFLNEASDSLSSISQKYETHRSDNFNELINYTFGAIHNVKGNSTIIGLDLIEKKLHSIEDIIVEMKSQLVVEGRDFLKIIYSVAEVIGILDNMKEMQKRIASIYNQVNTNINLDKRTNHHLISKLEDGLKTMSASHSKLVKLVFIDNEIIIPNIYLSSIKDVCIQLIKNSIIHGVESPEERIAQGKPATATVSIHLRNHNNEFQLEYGDDGKGLDVKKILSEAIRNRLIDKEEIKNITSKDVSELIFRSDFSTANVVDELAGRGQGMSIIKTAITKYGGSYKLGYKKNQYFKIRISLPIEDQFESINQSA